MSALASKTTVLPFKPRRPPKRTLPHETQPRQRLQHSGASALSDAELLSLVLSSGKTLDDVEHAQHLLYDAGGLAGLLTGGSHDLNSLKPARRARLLAAIELARRLAQPCPLAPLRGDAIPRRDLLDREELIAGYLAMKYTDRYQEMIGVESPQRGANATQLDARNRLIAERVLFRGTVNRLTADPRPILTQGLLCGASSMILFHNHPSNDSAPSQEDLAFTRRVADAGDQVNIRLLDHMVLGGAGRWCSLGTRGTW